jgi:hypothetical protein
MVASSLFKLLFGTGICPITLVHQSFTAGVLNGTPLPTSLFLDIGL